MRPYIWSHTSGPRKGEPFSPRPVQAMLKRVARRAGLENWERLTPHKLGRSLAEVRVLLGHSPVATGGAGSKLLAGFHRRLSLSPSIHSRISSLSLIPRSAA